MCFSFYHLYYLQSFLCFYIFELPWYITLYVLTCVYSALEYCYRYQRFINKLLLFNYFLSIRYPLLYMATKIHVDHMYLWWLAMRIEPKISWSWVLTSYPLEALSYVLLKINRATCNHQADFLGHWVWTGDLVAYIWLAKLPWNRFKIRMGNQLIAYQLTRGIYHR